MRKIVLIALVAAGAVAATAWAATTPSVVTGAATGVAKSGAVLHGTVDPGGSATTYTFQYGPTVAYGGVTAARKAGQGDKPVQVLAGLGGLAPGTVYHYRIEAANALGSALGADRIFATAGHPLPGVATAPPIAVGRTTATLEGTVVTNGETTSSYFQWGTAPTYGYQTAVANVTAATTPTGVAYTLTGLSPGTTFHYRLVAAHAGFGPELGADVAFTTVPLKRFRSTVTARTVPGRARHKPYLFTTSGTVVPLVALPPGVGCTGVVKVRFLLGNRTVAFRRAPVQANCTYLTGVGFRHRLDHATTRLRVKVHFAGNSYLRPASARTKRVRLG
jgi:phosphodiesterase/alkaline phosphatase D-like protein